jgi:hypothetical protein
LNKYLIGIVVFFILLNAGLWLYKNTVTNRAVRELVDAWKKAGIIFRVCSLLVVLTLFVYASVKPSNTASQATSPLLLEQVGIILSGASVADSGINIVNPLPNDSGSEPQISSNVAAMGFTVVSVKTSLVQTVWNIADLPSNMVASVNSSWEKTGRHHDGYWITTNGLWSFRLNNQSVDSFFLSSSGTLSFNSPKGAVLSEEMPDSSGIPFFAPLWGSMGLTSDPDIESHLWTAPTTNGNMLVTWENVLIDRISESNNIASFQAELCWNGDFYYRYNMNRNLVVSNHVIGAQNNGYAQSVDLHSATNEAVAVNALEIFWRGFQPYDIDPDGDTDDDGLSDYHEIMTYGTSPTIADSDHDGLSDSNEVANAYNPLNPDQDGDSIVDGLDVNVGIYDNPLAIDPVDGYTNGWKAANGLIGVDCSIDTDNDGYMDWMEAMAGTDPESSSDIPQEGQNESTLTDVTITLGYDLPAPVLVSIGERHIMVHNAGSWSVTLPPGIAHEVSVFATKPCLLMLGALLSSDRALLLDSSGVFKVSHPSGLWTAATMGVSPFTFAALVAPAGAVYVTGHLACGIFARPQIEIRSGLYCFHSTQAKTIVADVTPELDGEYQWIWSNDGAVSASTEKVTTISWEGTGSSATLEVNFLATGAVDPAFAYKTIYKCTHVDDPDSEDDDYEPRNGAEWCYVHNQWYSACLSQNIPEDLCCFCPPGTEPDPEPEYSEQVGKPVAVNNDDDDGDGHLDLYDTDGVIGDDDFVKRYPFSPYTGGCCPCPEHNPNASTTATRISCSPNLKTWADAAKTTQATTVGRGDAVYVEGTQASTYIGGDKTVWQWTANGETLARTNVYTIFSLRMFADLNLDDTINSNDYAGASSLTSHGWVMPVASNAFRKVQLKNDVNFTGTRTLTLSSSAAAVRVWTTATPSTNDTPLLVVGQTVTNGVDGANFAGYPESMIYVEAIGSGTATLSYNYVGTGEHATGLECKASLGMTVVKVDLVAETSAKTQLPLTECMEDREVTFTATAAGFTASQANQLQFTFHYEYADGTKWSSTDYWPGLVAYDDAPMDNVPDGDADHYFETPIYVEVSDDLSNKATSSEITIKVYELWVNTFKDADEDKEWKVVVGEPIEYEATASPDCTNWIWELSDGIVEQWHIDGASLRSGNNMIIPNSDMPSDDEWDHFGDTYGIVIVICEDEEGNEHNFVSTEIDSATKAEVYFDGTLATHPGGVEGQSKNWFYYWKYALFGDVELVSYNPNRTYGALINYLDPVVDPDNACIGEIEIGDNTNEDFLYEADHVAWLESLGYGYLPSQTRPSCGKSRIDLFYSILTHEIQHRNDEPHRKEWNEGDPLYVELDTDSLPDFLDYYDTVNNGKNYPEYFANGSSGAQGDWEHRARLAEDVPAVSDEKDWSKGGVEWKK